MQALRTEDPAKIGEYTVLGRLGNGAMGMVFLARSPGGRPVAVKVVRPELADDPGFRDRFRQEVASVRAVGGFWTAAVVDADPDGLWLATEYVPGPTLLAAVSSHGPLPVPALRGLVAGLAEALRAIHGAGLVHRDLKPANVLLAADGPRVIDFGIAKALESVGLTATGMFVGTPGFLSPEQIEGRDATPASDVFALGAVLVYAATGEGPFGSGDAAALMYRAVHATPDLDGVPAELRPLAARCLSRTPAERPTPAELLAEVGTPDAAEWLPEHVLAMVTEQETELGRPTPRPPTKPYTKVGPPAPAAGSPPGVGSASPGVGSPAPAVGSPPLPFGGHRHDGRFPEAPAPEAVPSPGVGSPAPEVGSVTPGVGSPAPGVGSVTPGVGSGVGSRAVFRVSRMSALILGVLTTVGAIVCLSISREAGAAKDGGGAVLFLVATVLLAVPAVRMWWILLRPRRWIEVSGDGLTVGRGGQVRLVPWSQLARVRVVEDGRRPWLVVWPHEPSRTALGPEYAGGFRVFPVGHERRKAGRQRETRELRAALGWYGRTAYDPSP